MARMTYTAEQLTYIAKVTELLNTLPANDDIYVHVELRTAEWDHEKIGEWSDEIAPDAWYYREISEQEANRP